MLIGSLILFGVLLLFGVWYNGKSFGEAKRDEEAAKADSDLAHKRNESLEKADAEEDERRGARDEEDAAAALRDGSAVDFLRKSFRAPNKP